MNYAILTSSESPMKFLGVYQFDSLLAGYY